MLDVVEQDQTNEAAWYWLYKVFDRKDDQRICLENLIILNPNNHWAKQELLNFLDVAGPADHAQVEVGTPVKAKKRSKSSRKTAKRSPVRPVTLKLITAFWIGISIIFLGSGIISFGTWLLFRLSGQDIPNQNSQLLQSFELLIGIIFIVAGALGLYVTIMLFVRSMTGFYGSLLLALGLLLVGPTISLITIPPNYITMVCTGGISGMIVLLTLASQPGFENILQNDNTSD